MQLLHEKINGRLPLIGVGNLLNAEQILAAYQTGWAEFVAMGKAVLLNPDLAVLLKSGKENQIVDRLDPAQADHYGLPDRLWEMCQQGESWLPPVKGKAWQPLDR